MSLCDGPVGYTMVYRIPFSETLISCLFLFAFRAEVSHGFHRRSFRPGWLGWISAVHSGSWWQGQRFLGRLDPKLCGEAYLAIFLLVLRDYRRFQRKRCESRKTTKSMHSSLWRLRNYVEMLWHWKRKREDETSGLPHCHGRSGYRMIQNDT